MLRGATLVRDLSRTLRDTVIPLTTDVCHTLQILGYAFDCTLRGPFDGRHSPNSQLRGLSVQVVPPLFPHHRFHAPSIAHATGFVNTFAQKTQFPFLLLDFFIGVCYNVSIFIREEVYYEL